MQTAQSPKSLVASEVGTGLTMGPLMPLQNSFVRLRLTAGVLKKMSLSYLKNILIVRANNRQLLMRSNSQSAGLKNILPETPKAYLNSNHFFHLGLKTKCGKIPGTPTTTRTEL
jgi:hypothetical protein